MPLNQINYQALCNIVGIRNKYWNYTNGYTYCNKLYNQYLALTLKTLTKINYQEITFIFLESCPEITSDYIFDLGKKVHKRSYLWNICIGFDIKIQKAYFKLFGKDSLWTRVISKLLDTKLDLR